MSARQNGPLGFHLRLDDKLAQGFPPLGHSLRLSLPGSIGTRTWHVAAGLCQRRAHEHQNHPPGGAPLKQFQQALIDMQIKVREGHGRKAVEKLE